MIEAATPVPGALGELRRGASLVFACTIGFGFSLSGIPFYTLGVFVDPLHDAFGWSVAAIQGGLTVSFLTTMLVLPLVAWLTDRFGPRRVALTSLVAMSFAFMSLSRLDGRLWLYYAHWSAIALFGTGSLAVTWTGPITRAFSSARGLALGLSLLGTGVMGFLGPPVARTLVDAVGWRAAFVWLGAAPIVFAVPPTWWFFHDRIAASPRAHRPRGRPAALNDPRLAILALAIALVAMAVAGVIPNLIKALTSGGLSRREAVTAASAVGVFVVVGRAGCGALIDRFWAPAVAAGFLVASALACLALAWLHVNALGAILGAALVGLSAGAEFDLLPFMVSRYFAAAPR